MSKNVVQLADRWRGQMTDLDRACIAALQPVRFGIINRAGEISRSLHLRMTKGQPITARERHALYAIAFRFRAQLQPELLDQVTAALAGAAAAVALYRMDKAQDYPQARPARSVIRAVRNFGAPPSAAVNPLDDLFPATA